MLRAYAEDVHGIGGYSAMRHQYIGNTPPVAYDQQRVSLEEDSSATILLPANDVNNDTLRYNIVRQPLHGDPQFSASFITG